MGDIIGVLELINMSCCVTVVHPTSLLPKRLTVPVNCIHTFRLLSRIDYATPAVSCVFAYIVVLFQMPIDRDIVTSIRCIGLSEWYRTRTTTALIVSAHQQSHYLNMFLHLPKKSSYFGNDLGDQYLLSSLFSIDTSISLPGSFY